ncbi:PIG-L deacetylase family protein [Pararobbsia alpina]|uniref:1D-myo-inositol 2-acetamido-2-deoxy-alpha-D-glucopyranoside deacetylase n=1 Tax=Pararobbsia alpina TaxID=621374 RepID=A0A6S7BF40_9BURK|nr:PIG-L family deacetylase [Pararobbsia alpina]CAB3788973.1 1D-myo-inositol 2-acetamido-2-deoxy-alpha-D-glucopyranoside deacetylase [Pararobbsia alpina]
MEALKPRIFAGEGTPESDWLNWNGLAALHEIGPEALVPFDSRAVFVAPHPDDEVLGMGGLMARLAKMQRRLALVAVTDGDASHQGSSLWPVERLRTERPVETRAALQRLHASNVELTRMQIGDGQVRYAESHLTERLKAMFRSTDVVITTWRLDGHPDHEATGRATAQACLATGATLIEVPVWTWHWASPGDARVPWSRARRLSLDAGTHARKRDAVQAFTSQIEDDPSTGRQAVLSPHVLDRLLRDFEVVFV